MLKSRKIKEENEPLEAPIRIVQFSNGIVKRKQNCLQFQSYRSTELTPLARPKRIIVAASQRLEYAGSNHESELSRITSSVLKVGIYNKKTCTMKVYDVDFHHLRPILKFTHGDRCMDIKTAATEKSWKEKTQDLALAFGSKNLQKMVSSRLKFETTENKNTEIETSISAEFIEAEKARTAVVEPTQESEVIPPQNKLAESADKVYNIYDIISEEEFNCLDSSCFIELSREELEAWKIEKKYCAFIINFLEIHFHNIPLQKAKMLCYLQYMLCLMKKQYKDLRRKDPAPEIPEPFKRSLLEKYTISRSMPSSKKDKILAHATVLALMVNNYHLDGGIWALSTGIPYKRLVLVCYTIGCHVSERRGQETKLIELKLPLYKYVPMKKFQK